MLTPSDSTPPCLTRTVTDTRRCREYGTSHIRHDREVLHLRKSWLRILSRFRLALRAEEARPKRSRTMGVPQWGTAALLAIGVEGPAEGAKREQNPAFTCPMASGFVSPAARGSPQSPLHETSAIQALLRSEDQPQGSRLYTNMSRRSAPTCCQDRRSPSRSKPHASAARQEPSFQGST